jgi:N-methylhydantoinase A
MIRIASDIGGTFTDVVLDVGGVLHTAKVLTTPGAPEQGLLAGVDRVLKDAGVAPGAVDQMIHGTTLATNALIERKGARTVQIVTAGFRDVLEMAHENRFDQYDLSMDRAPPLVERALRWEASERIAADGRVLRALDEGGAGALIARLQSEAVESVAISFLHAYANPAHERRLAELIRAAAPDMFITLSSEVSPEIREYERFATACANAYVQPLMSRYLAALSAELTARGVACPLFLVTSGGDLTDLATAMAYPVRLVESGPAGGAVLAAEIARAHGLDEVLAFDMGGTTAKLCLIDQGKPQMTRSFEVGRMHENMKGSGFPVRIPAIDLVEIGSGGGSIARVDPLGRLLVGPRSAGAVPGPACYGRGGRAPTVTDADLLLGRIDPGAFSGGVGLDLPAARAAMERDVATPLGLSETMAAFAVAEIVDENMASAARVHAIESGRALSSRVLIAFGGAAPLHAASLATKLGIPHVMIPAHAGVGSAVGFLAAGLAFEQARSLFMALESFDAARVNAVLGDMASAARTLLGGEGHAFAETRTAYMRYRGQGHEITVPAPNGVLGADAARGLRQAFDARYAQLFGATVPRLPVEILTWTVRVERRDAVGADRVATGRDVAAAAPRSFEVFDAAAGGPIPYAALSRSSLAPAARHAGPCLVIEDQTTTVVPSGFDLEVLSDGALWLSRRQSPSRLRMNREAHGAAD